MLFIEIIDMLAVGRRINNSIKWRQKTYAAVHEIQCVIKKRRLRNTDAFAGRIRGIMLKTPRLAALYAVIQKSSDL